MTFRRSKRNRVQVICTEEERRTKSEFAKDCDINRIMAKYKGPLPHGFFDAKARFGDFSQIPDFMVMQDKILAANEMFMALPAAVRKQFDNDPHKFIEGAQTEEGRELLKKLGLGSEKGEKDPRASTPSMEASLPPAAGQAAPTKDDASGVAGEGSPAPTKKGK